MAEKQTASSFWSRVNIDLENPQNCWEWLGSCNNSGYGTVAWEGKVYVAHRVAAWLDGLVNTLLAPKHKADKGFVLHKCDNRKCCNPNHFFIGSYTDNQLDAYRKKRKVQAKGETHTNAKLTRLQAEEIRARYKAGEYQIPLSMEYGVSQRTISLIVRGETYK
jgi:hypothetical protein